MAATSTCERPSFFATVAAASFAFSLAGTGRAKESWMTPSSLRSPYGRIRCSLGSFQHFEGWIEVIGAPLDHPLEARAALGGSRGIPPARLADGRHQAVARRP